MSQERGRAWERDEETAHSLVGVVGSSAPARSLLIRVWQRWAAGLRSSVVAEAFEAERARWVMWMPVAFGAGIATYFQAGFEPTLTTALSWPVIGIGLLILSRATGSRLLCLTLLVSGLGFAAAKLRCEGVRAPVLERSISRAEIVGTITLVEPRPGGGVRITLRDLSITGLAASKTPTLARIRVLRPAIDLEPGNHVRLTARLSPPQGPALPGGYDFARTAWFWRLGATGFAFKAPVIERTPLDRDDGVMEHVMRASREMIEAVRQDVARRISAAVPGELGALATALITGERGGISDETTDAFRASGLLHILSISGLHMVVMAGAVYAGVRALLAAFPALALAFPIRRWAAAAASLAAFFYLLLSGASIATVRAYVMIAIMFLAVMMDRPALALRNVAASAMFILVFMPESLLDPGFQMSFACVVALVSAYEAMRNRRERLPREPDDLGPVLQSLRRLAVHLRDIVISTLIASVAVAPFAIYHFHKSQQFALIANLIAIPISNIIVMPAGLMTLLAMPFGLEALPLAVMSWGLEAMRATAAWVASLPGAVARVSAISDLAFALMVVGGLWLALWETLWRVAGIVVIAAGAALAPWHPAPSILVGEGGRMVAVRGLGGDLQILAERGREFALTQWLEFDGDEREARDARQKSAFVCDRAGCTMIAPGVGLVAVTRHESALADDCAKADVLISRAPVTDACPHPGLIIEGRRLYRTGPLAIFVKPQTEGSSLPESFELVTSQTRRGERPWTALPAQSAREAKGVASPGQGGRKARRDDTQESPTRARDPNEPTTREAVPEDAPESEEP